MARAAESRTVGTKNSLVARTSLAINESFKKGDNWEEITTYISVVFWNRLAKRLIDQGITKGSEVVVEGRIRTDQYDDANGQKVTQVYVQVTDLILIRQSGSERSATSGAVEGAKGDEDVYIQQVAQNVPFPEEEPDFD